MPRREFQADFETALHRVVRTSTETRPDAIQRSLVAYAPGPEEIQNAQTGLLVRSWKVQVDNEEGEVYIARGGPEGFEEAALLFTYTGAAITQVSLAFDQNGNPYVAAARGGNVWLRYFDTVAAANVFTDFGTGRDPRLILDDPQFPQDSDVILFYVASGGIRYRLQRDRYLTEYDGYAGMEPTDHLEGVFRDRSRRIHLVRSHRDLVAGTWELSRLTSSMYPVPAVDSGEISHDTIGMELRQTVLLDEFADEALLGHSTVSMEVTLANLDYAIPQEGLDIAFALTEVEIQESIIALDGEDLFFDLAHTTVSLDNETVVILIELELFAELSHTTVSLNLDVP